MSSRSLGDLWQGGRVHEAEGWRATVLQKTIRRLWSRRGAGHCRMAGKLAST